MSTTETDSGPTAAAVPALRRPTEFAMLSRQVRQAGLLRRRTGYYIVRTTVAVVALAALWASFLLIGDSWGQLAVAVPLAAAFTQIGFLVHDAGHGQIFTSRRANALIGVPLANLAIGLSYSWWVEDHNRHHAHPNQLGKDPGVEIGAVAFTVAQAGGRGRLARMSYRYQAYYFFPLLLLTAFGLHLYSVRHLAGRAMRGRACESALLIIHTTCYLGLVLWVLAPIKAVAFVVVQQGLFGLYVGCSIASNHKGMPMLDTDHRIEFVRRQVTTSRNVRGGRLADVVFGGLNLQIEHHLFPTMPQVNLRHARPIVRRFCEQQGLPYCETGLLDSYAQALRHLHAVGRESTT